MSLSQADILRALELVKLPASGQSLAASGRVADILIDDFVAPCHGKHHIADYFQERYAEMGQGA